MRRSLGFIALLFLAFAGWALRDEDSSLPTLSTASTPSAAEAGYILALSWSPAWCASKDRDGSTDQCARDADLGLVVHGLWADSRGHGATDCPTDEPDRLPDDLAERVLRFMPSLGLARHEWQKHGSCMGLGQRGYFETMERAWRRIRLPDSLAAPRAPRHIERSRLLADISAQNPSLPKSALALQCSRDGSLTELRICLTSALDGRPCSASTGRTCPKALTIMPPP